MTALPFIHGQFALTRVWKASPEKVFRAWSDPDMKMRWFAGPSGEWEVMRREMDFRVGGVELVEGRFLKTGMVSRYQGTPRFIEPNERLVLVYDMWIDGAPLSSSLSSLRLEAVAGGTKASYVEQLVFLDGKDGTASRIEGTQALFDALARVVES